MTRITLTLKLAERDALHALADFESRDPRIQAVLLIRRELIRLGFLVSERKDRAEILSEETENPSREIERTIGASTCFHAENFRQENEKQS